MNSISFHFFWESVSFFTRDLFPLIFTVFINVLPELKLFPSNWCREAHPEPGTDVAPSQKGQIIDLHKVNWTLWEISETTEV